METMYYYVEWYIDPNELDPYSVGIFKTREDAIQAIETIRIECEEKAIEDIVDTSDTAFFIKKLFVNRIDSDIIEKIQKFVGQKK